MPVYEYECRKCGTAFEIKRSITDRNRDAKCPNCSDESAQRVYSVFCTPSFPGNDTASHHPT